MSPAVARRVLQTFHQRARQRRDLESLTQREGDVLRRIAEGSDVGEVATDLEITVRTVQTHLRHIYEKLQVHSRSQAVARYYRETRTTGAQA
jgi:DNA-binding NarL/FixJ family response regulator